MKILLILLSLVILAGCHEPELGRGQPLTMQKVEDGNRVDIYKDTRTGCHYITVFKGGIVPRMYSDGVQVCD